MQNLALKTVKFHNQDLITLEHEGVAHVAMKPIVEGMGVDWAGQHKKLVGSERYGHMSIPCETAGGLQDLLCIPLIKLNGWLFSINPAKVREDIRDTVIQYQEECFVVLYNYWNKGSAINPRVNLNENQKGHVKIEMNKRIRRLGSSYQAEWSQLNTHFGVAQYKDIKAEHYPLVCEYLGVEPLEGEFVPKAAAPKKQVDVSYLYMWQKVAQRRLHELKEVERVMYNALGELSKVRANLYDPIIEPLGQLNVAVGSDDREGVLDRADKIIQEQDYLRLHKQTH